MRYFCLRFPVCAPSSGPSWHLSRQPLLWQPLSSRSALHGLRGFKFLQGKTPWVAPGCADRPGFLGLGSAPAPAFTWSRILSFFPGAWASILLYGPLDIAWICCPQLRRHPCKNGTHSTCFYSTGGHTRISLFVSDFVLELKTFESKLPTLFCNPNSLGRPDLTICIDQAWVSWLRTPPKIHRGK